MINVVAGLMPFHAAWMGEVLKPGDLDERGHPVVLKQKRKSTIACRVAQPGYHEGFNEIPFHPIEHWKDLIMKKGE